MKKKTNYKNEKNTQIQNNKIVTTPNNNKKAFFYKYNKKNRKKIKKNLIISENNIVLFCRTEWNKLKNSFEYGVKLDSKDEKKFVSSEKKRWRKFKFFLKKKKQFIIKKKQLIRKRRFIEKKRAAIIFRKKIVPFNMNYFFFFYLSTIRLLKIRLSHKKSISFSNYNVLILVSLFKLFISNNLLGRKLLANSQLFSVSNRIVKLSFFFFEKKKDLEKFDSKSRRKRKRNKKKNLKKVLLKNKKFSKKRRFVSFFLKKKKNLVSENSINFKQYPFLLNQLYENQNHLIFNFFFNFLNNRRLCFEKRKQSRIKKKSPAVRKLFYEKLVKKAKLFENIDKLWFVYDRINDNWLKWHISAFVAKLYKQETVFDKFLKRLFFFRKIKNNSYFLMFKLISFLPKEQISQKKNIFNNFFKYFVRYLKRKKAKRIKKLNRFQNIPYIIKKKKISKILYKKDSSRKIFIPRKTMSNQLFRFRLFLRLWKRSFYKTKKENIIFLKKKYLYFLKILKSKVFKLNLIKKKKLKYYFLQFKKKRSNYYFTVSNHLGEVIYNISSGRFLKQTQDKRNRKARNSFFSLNSIINNICFNLKKKRIFKINVFLKPKNFKSHLIQKIIFGFLRGGVKIKKIKNLISHSHGLPKKNKKIRRI